MQREIDLLVDHPTLKYQEDAVLAMVISAIESIGIGFPHGDLSIAIFSDPKVAEIHGEYLDDPTVTDVITFPGDKEMSFAGEICVSADRAYSCFKENQTSFAQELTLYIVHGLLHLAGYNDKKEAQITRMRQGEKETMQLLQSSNHIPHFRYD